MRGALMVKPGDDVWYQTDGRNGLDYYLPAKVTVVRGSHPGDYPDGSTNPLPVPSSDEHVHLTVFTPGGFGTRVVTNEGEVDPADTIGGDEIFKSSERFVPGSGTYVELDVNYDSEGSRRSWRWPDE